MLQSSDSFSLFSKRQQSMWAALFAAQAAIAVAAGAFGAHALEGMLDVKALGWWQTGSQYLMYHALSGLIVSTVLLSLPSRKLILCLFFLGNMLFAGSLYAMALTGYRFLGAVTPLGGLCYLLAWCFLIYRLWRLGRSQ